MANRAMRVLALAHRSLPAEYTEDDLGRGYTLSGLIGLVDPVRPAAPAAIKALHRAGIRTVMITGDQALTATAVARELGLSRRGQLNVLEAGDLSALDGEALRGLVRDVNIFARVAPEMKLAVVRAHPGERRGRGDDRRRRQRRAGPARRRRRRGDGRSAAASLRAASPTSCSRPTTSPRWSTRSRRAGWSAPTSSACCTTCSRPTPARSGSSPAPWRSACPRRSRRSSFSG